MGEKNNVQKNKNKNKKKKFVNGNNTIVSEQKLCLSPSLTPADHAPPTCRNREREGGDIEREREREREKSMMAPTGKADRLNKLSKPDVNYTINCSCLHDLHSTNWKQHQTSLFKLNFRAPELCVFSLCHNILISIDTFSSSEWCPYLKYRTTMMCMVAGEKLIDPFYVMGGLWVCIISTGGR